MRSSSKTQESNGHGKTSAAGGSRKDTKDGSSVGAGSRSRRRGTIENTEADIKHPNTSNIKTKEKGIKEKDKLKNGTKSAKKVAMENEKEKISDTTTSGNTPFLQIIFLQDSVGKGPLNQVDLFLWIYLTQNARIFRTFYVFQCYSFRT